MINYFTNIIFLDVDGVLNCQLHYQSRQFKDYRDAKKTLRKQVKSGEIERLEFYASQISSLRIGMLNELCQDTNSAIVVSSTWRHGKCIDELQEIFNNSGATFLVIGKTPSFDSVRGHEIQQWLHDNCEKYFGVPYYDFHRYAIVDDDSDMLLPQAPHFFQTDPYSGLTWNTCYRIRRFLLHQTF